MVFGAYGGLAGRKIGYLCGLLLTTALASLSVFPAKAQDASRPVILAQASEAREFNIPAQPLTSALALFGQQSGLQITADGDLVRNVSSPGVQGRLASADALRRLLAGTGLGYSLSGATITLQKLSQSGRPGDVQLGVVRVQADALAGSAYALQSDGTARQGYRSDLVSGVGPWQGRSLQDTPYSVTVFSRELLENLQVTTPDQIYRVAPTVQFLRPQYENDQSQVNMRGFYVLSTYLDGLRNTDSGYGVTTEDAERVEIFTGLSGFLYGPANVGGMINYISKRPTAERLNRVTLGNAGGENFYLRGDFGGPIDPEGRFGYRINASWQDGETAVSHIDMRKFFVSGAFDWHVTDTLLWQFDAAYRDYQVDGVQPLWIGTAATRPSADDMDTTVLWGQPWSQQWVKTDRYGSQLRWDASEVFSLRAAWKYHHTRRGSAGSLNIIGAGRTYTQIVFGNYAPGDNTQVLDETSHNGQVFADFDFSTGPVEHKLTAGAQYRTYWNYGFLNSAPNVTYTGLSLDRPAYMPRPVPAPVNRGPKGKTNAYSYTTYLIGDDIKFDEQWSLLAGAALSTIDVEATTFLSPIAGYKKSAITPNISLVYKPIESISAYVTFIQSLEQGGVAAPTFNGVPVANAGQVFEPLISEQIELGAKWSVGELLLSAALFQIDKGLQYYDLSNPAAIRYVQDGREVHRGIEFTTFGKLTDELTLTGGLTLMDNTVEDQKQTPALEGKRPANVSDTLIKLRAEYLLPFVEGLSVSGGVNYAGSQFGDPTNTDRLGDYTLLDIGARYEFTAGDRPLTLRLDVNNLTDKGYWIQNVTLGTPRTVMFSVSTQF